MLTITTETSHPNIVTREQWIAARKALLAKEKAATRAQDALSAERRRLPMVKVDKDYLFEGPAGWGGSARLADLFDGCRQLIVYHFMFEPGDPPPGKSAPWTEGCPGCSFLADHLPNLLHLRARDTALALVSRAALSKIEPFRKRMGWTVPWYSSFGSDFNYDFHVTADESVAPVEYNYATRAELAAKGHSYHIQGEQPGLSVFLQVGGEIYHTYSTFARGLEPLLVTYRLLDMTPFGRQEKWEDSPPGWPQGPTHAWLRHHDRYTEPDHKPACCCSSTNAKT